jgi:magnesium chelatase family protein
VKIMSEPSYLALYRSGELQKRAARVTAMLECCRVCPRDCRVDRTRGKRGYCRTGRYASVASIGPHFGEEAPLVGFGGSGTIFFSSCNLLCTFCQNYEISHFNEGAEVQPHELVDMMLRLERAGCHNINLVTPSHVVPQILEALPLAVEGGLRLPLVYNTGGYDCVETLKLLRGVVDIYMPDFKFWDPGAAKVFCNAPDYPDRARAAIREMHSQVGDLVTDSRGVAVKGILVRHLVMPEDTCGTAEIMSFLASEISPDTSVNIMDQYYPCYRACEDRRISRRITRGEYARALSRLRMPGSRRSVRHKCGTGVFVRTSASGVLGRKNLTGRTPSLSWTPTAEKGMLGYTMIAIVHSACPWGTDALGVVVEVDVHAGLPGFSIVGLPDNVVKESRERIRSAIINSGLEFPPRRITVNLAPADRKKEGGVFDLPICIAVLCALGIVPQERISGLMFIGELGLDGGVRPVRGAISAAFLAGKQEFRGVVCPETNAGEAALSGVKVWPVRDIKEIVQYLRTSLPDPYTALPPLKEPGEEALPDLADITGQDLSKRALEIAAAGGHNILFLGPPGAGKSMLAKRMPSILPPLSREEFLECTRIYSAAGRLGKGPLSTSRPFRSPHHTISDAGLIGGGSIPAPGEITLSHNGVLFLDELPEFRRSALESLRQPLEEGSVTISRANGVLSFPARFQLIGAMNPCPCGFLGHPSRECRCTPTQLSRYRTRVSGPLLDRIDLHVWVDPVDASQVLSRKSASASSSIRLRVEKARAVQEERGCLNAHIPEQKIEKICRIDAQAGKLLVQAMKTWSLSMRGFKRVMKVARSIADLDGSPDVRSDHLAEALQYRPELAKTLS